MDADEAQALGEEAERLLAEIAGLWTQIRAVHPPDRLPTDTEVREIMRLHVEVGKLAEAYSRVWEFGPAPKYPCPCCGLFTLEEEPPGTYQICPVCWWEDDPIQFCDPDYRGGANRESLNEVRSIYEQYGTVGLKRLRELMEAERSE